jgi:Ala-tRNA(Pro) deacylase
MAACREALFERLAALGIETETVAHAPVFTVEESKALRGDLPGGHCKNLMFKDKKGALWLVVCLEDTQVDIKALEKLIGSARLSFAKPDLLQAVLGVDPGSVTPFGLINDTEAQVTVVLDKTMLQSSVLNYHPLKNDATTRIRPDDLQKFIAACGHRAKIVDLPG